MKTFKQYNESIRDKMKPKSKEEILDSVENPTQAMIDQINNSDINDYANEETINNIRLLLDNGADVSSGNYAALRFGIWVGDLDFVKELIDEFKVSINAGDAFQTAAHYNKPEILQYIIDKGIDVKEYGVDALEQCIDNSLNNETPIINDCVLILVKNGAPKVKVKNWLHNYFSDKSIEGIMFELDEKLNKRYGSK